jgi:hypothetical protein
MEGRQGKVLDVGDVERVEVVELWRLFGVPWVRLGPVRVRQVEVPHLIPVKLTSAHPAQPCTSNQLLYSFFNADQDVACMPVGWSYKYDQERGKRRDLLS